MYSGWMNGMTIMTRQLITSFLLKDRLLQILWKRRLIIFLFIKSTLIKMVLIKCTKLLRLKMSPLLTMLFIVDKITTLLSEMWILMTFSTLNYLFLVSISLKLYIKCLPNFRLCLMLIISKFPILWLLQWNRLIHNKTLTYF